MSSSARAILFGRSVSPRGRYVSLGLAVVLFGITVLAYALDVFEVAGGVVFVPGHAALVGIVGAAWVGYRRRGLAVAWLVAYAALLGYSADHSFLGLSGRSLSERATAFLQPDGLVFLGIEGLVFGTLGFLAGTLCNRGIALVRDRSTSLEAR